MLVETCAIVETLPKGTHLHLITDVESFWKAFHSDHDWFRKWQEDGFVKKPAKDRDIWK